VHPIKVCESRSCPCTDAETWQYVVQNKSLEKLKGSLLLKNTQVEKTPSTFLSFLRNMDFSQLHLFFPLNVFL